MKSDPALSTKDVAEKNDISKLTNKKFLTRKIQWKFKALIRFALNFLWNTPPSLQQRPQSLHDLNDEYASIKIGHQIEDNITILATPSFTPQ